MCPLKVRPLSIVREKEFQSSGKNYFEIPLIFHGCSQLKFPGGGGGCPAGWKSSFCNAKRSISGFEAGLINEGDASPWQYRVWTVVCLRLRVMLGHGSTESGLVSA